MRLIHHIVLLLVFLSPCIFSAEVEPHFDEGDNPDIDNQLFHLRDPNCAANRVEQASGIPNGSLGPIIGYSDEVAARARFHLDNNPVLFGLTHEPGNRRGALAFTPYTFNHPVRGELTFSVLLLSVSPGSAAQLLGEAYIPSNDPAMGQRVWDSLMRQLRYRKRDLINTYGHHALEFF